MSRICHVTKIIDNDQIYIQKLSDRVNLDIEYKSLEYLRERKFNIPIIYFHNNEKLVMEYVEDSKGSEELLKLELNKLHSHTSEYFGFDQPSYSGFDLMPNNYEKDWATFFKLNRWKIMIDNIRSESTENDFWTILLKIYDLIPHIFKDKIIVPSLLHGDMNPNNFLMKDDKIYFIDCSCFYGDKKYDQICFDFWIHEIDETNDIELLYASFILLTTSRIAKNSYYNKARKFMRIILTHYPTIYRTVHKFANDPITINPDCLIIQGGSYNPIHKNHINNVIKAYEHLGKIYKNVRNGIDFFHRKNMLLLAINKLHIPKIIDLSGMWNGDIIMHYKYLFPDVREIFVCCGSDVIKYQFEHFNSDQKFICFKRKHHETILDDRIINIRPVRAQGN